MDNGGTQRISQGTQVTQGIQPTQSTQSRADATASLPTIATVMSGTSVSPAKQPKPFLRGRGFVKTNETRRRTTPTLDEIRLRLLQKHGSDIGTPSRHVSEGKTMIATLGRRGGGVRAATTAESTPPPRRTDIPSISITAV
ncbi:hypothetical protein J056_003950 [Wallemia ichthyophaga EXF-994]|uniref:Uncharacterized protein n=1 Tax=Wallemia ichthyophaga (strain EXF-994 / CBS 113033) TaxID=1299270 RepID=R9AHM9_WALI9|nr:uncharacterized protein J056_003950 [Wallemia ichthyophaga EXF-994]EOR01714.1 hypothetical protein J056_003950 [Wallemia ichthyophaga EXF-994]